MAMRASVALTKAISPYWCKAWQGKNHRIGEKITEGVIYTVNVLVFPAQPIAVEPVSDPAIDEVKDNVLSFVRKIPPESKEPSFDIVLDEIALAWMRAFGDALD